MTYDMTRRSVLRAGLAGSGAAVLSTVPALRALAQEPGKPAELIVRAWGGEWVDSLNKAVSQPFTDATGINIRHDLTEDNELQPKIWAAVAQNRIPPVHVNWDTNTNGTKSALRGVTVDLSDLENLAHTNELATPVGLDGHPIMNVYGYAYVLAYRTDAFPDGPPQSWNEMLNPKFKGRVALYNDGIGLHFPAVIAGGGTFADIPDNMSAAWDFFSKLKKQAPLLGEDPDFTTWFQNGEIDLACTISSNAAAAQRNGVPVAWTIPVEGATFNTDNMWVPRGLPDNETYWAKQYINFAISKDAQQRWLDRLGLPGVAKGLTPPPGLENDPSYPTTEADFARLLRVSDRVQVEHESDWFAKFKEIMQG